MDFFSPVVPPARWHHNFSHAMAPYRQAERDLFNAWAEGFPDRDGKLIAEFQTSFNSTFWEVYLHAMLKSYNMETDWSQSSPDFVTGTPSAPLVIEAVTAAAALGKPNEWDRMFTAEELLSLKFKAINTEAIIRLSNSILSKYKKYCSGYAYLDHVKGKPFVIAVAPFEQPHFNLQCDRPIRALLYDHYVDEDEYMASPAEYPEGPPARRLGYVRKDNGAEIPLGFFNDDGMSHLSAVVYSCTATWGKLAAMAKNPYLVDSVVQTLWATPPRGAPTKKTCKILEHEESILDGLQVYHNPFACQSLSPAIFRAPRVVQHFWDFKTHNWSYEGRTDALLTRQVWAVVPREYRTNAGENPLV
jgi:hypothetical protein